jgi:hypothetical protein
LAQAKNGISKTDLKSSADKSALLTNYGAICLQNIFFNKLFNYITAAPQRFSMFTPEIKKMVYSNVKPTEWRTIFYFGRLSLGCGAKPISAHLGFMTLSL